MLRTECLLDLPMLEMEGVFSRIIVSHASQSRQAFCCTNIYKLLPLAVFRHTQLQHNQFVLGILNLLWLHVMLISFLGHELAQMRPFFRRALQTKTLSKTGKSCGTSGVRASGSSPVRVLVFGINVSEGDHHLKVHVNSAFKCIQSDKKRCGGLRYGCTCSVRLSCRRPEFTFCRRRAANVCFFNHNHNLNSMF